MRRALRVGTAVALLVAAGAVWAHWPPRQAAAGTQATRVLVEKSVRRLTVLHDDKAIGSYTIALGLNPVGPKTRQGDNRTPEGLYVIDWRTPGGRFRRALHVSYPNAPDRLVAKGAGVDPGGDIFIHGIKSGFGWLGRAHRLVDWTAGCIAVTNAEIDQIWRQVPNGTVVEIRP
jgi:murein L,D-transpeptidase YafK